jgi:hypothetical protein
MKVCLRWQVDRHACNHGGKVRAVIEVETSEVVLIRFALATVLAGNQTGHCFEHLRGPHDRPCLQLFGRDRSLTGGTRHADQILCGVLQVRYVAKRPRPCHDDVGRQRKSEYRIGRHRLSGDDVQCPPDDGEVDQLERQFRRSCWDVLDAIVTRPIGYSGGLHAIAVQVDGHTWENPPRLIGDAADNRAA